MAPRTKKDPAAPAEGTRKSTRLADKPAPAAVEKPKAKVAKAKAAGKPAAKEKEKEEEEEEEKAPASKKRAAPEEGEEPAAKKAKPASKPASKAAATKPASKSKPASKAAAGKASKAEPIAEEKAAEAEAAAEAPAAAPAETKGAAELGKGDGLPDLTLLNQAEEEVRIRGLVGKDKGLILFLVPKANTPGCTKQACGFRDAYPDYTALGYEVYCLSGDAPGAQAKWKTAQKLPYPLLSDKDHALIRALGASAPGNKTKRSHFVFEKGSGTLVLKSVGVKPEESPKQVLQFLKTHHK